MQTLDVLQQQKIQYKHDQRNHADILYLNKIDRMKHYGLHFAKYVGRLIREGGGPSERTLVDAMLVSLSCANTLNINLGSASEIRNAVAADNRDFLVKFADQMGVLADACEKIDHLEPFEYMARNAATAMYFVLIEEFERRNLDAKQLLAARRDQLSRRPVYIE